MLRPRRRQLVPVVLGLCVLATGLASAATVHLSGPAGAEVRLDGEVIGTLPLAPIDLPVGTHMVTCRAHGYEDIRQSIDVTDPTAMLHVQLRMIPLRRGRAVSGSLLYAGLGQWYAGAEVRGWVYFLGESVGLVTALAGELARVNEKDEYVNAIRNYELAVDIGQITFWRNEAATAYQNVSDMEDVRDLGLMIAGGAWALSLLDAWLLTPTVDVGMGAVPPRAAGQAALVEPTTSGWPSGVHAAVTIDF